jgi:tyrosinase
LYYCHVALVFAKDKTGRSTMQGFDRRSLLQGGAAVALATAASATDALAQKVKLNQNALRITLQPVLRRSVNTMALNDPMLDSYRKAVAAMKALPASDPRNWTNQSNIHLNNCPHGNWFFLPWHRAYLVAFERLCRQLSGNAGFALPYWDWTANPQLPAAFAAQNYNGQPNPLYDGTRPSQTVTISSTYAGPTKMAAIYAETSFEVFGSTRPTGQNSTASSWQRVTGVKGPFESGPHDHVHTTVLGDMLQLWSPLDPIFWLHHCNIDRIWDHWNNLGRANSSDPLWRTFAYNGQFANPSGASGTTPYNPTVAGLLNIADLGYRYTLPLFSLSVTQAILDKFINPGDPVESIKLKMGTSAKINVATTARAQLAAPQTLALARSTASFRQLNATTANPVQARGRVLVFIRDVEVPMDTNADVRVFINHPDPNIATSVEDRHYAGSFTFFGHGHAMHGGNPSYMLDITQTVNNLQIAGVDLAKEINVQLVPVPISGVAAAEEIKVGSVDVAIF